MGYLRASITVLVTAMTFSLTPLGRPARAAEDKPAAGAMIGTNTIVAPSGTSLSTISVTLIRYKKTLLQAWTEYNPSTCKQISAGAWTITIKPNAMKGTATTGTVSGQLGNGDCPGTTFTFAAIYYEWTAHNNRFTNPAISATFSATWKAPDFTLPYTFNIKVPVVRPASETTAFVDWDPAGLTDGRWKQTLHPPASDPTFNFSTESVQEADAAGAHSDTCWFPASAFAKFDKITGGTWTVAAGNVWSFDHVGWFSPAATYYRLPHGGVPARAFCGSRFTQQMTIKALPDTSYNNYAGINVLGGDIGKVAVSSTRAGSSKAKVWP